MDAESAPGALRRHSRGDGLSSPCSGTCLALLGYMSRPSVYMLLAKISRSPNTMAHQSIHYMQHQYLYARHDGFLFITYCIRCGPVGVQGGEPVDRTCGKNDGPGGSDI